MNQSRLESFIETITNTAIGYLVALASQIIIFPWLDIDVTIGQNLLIGFWFTIISIGRGYIVRRWFNSRIKGFARAVAK